MEDCGHLWILDGKQPPLMMNTGYDLAVGDLEVKKVKNWMGVVLIDTEITQDGKRIRNMVRIVAKCPCLVIKEPGD